MGDSNPCPAPAPGPVGMSGVEGEKQGGRRGGSEAGGEVEGETWRRDREIDRDLQKTDGDRRNQSRGRRSWELGGIQVWPCTCEILGGLDPPPPAPPGIKPKKEVKVKEKVAFMGHSEFRGSQEKPRSAKAVWRKRNHLQI